jgi:hypothetical protein
MGGKVAGEIVTPKCELSGLPLPVLPEEPRLSGVFSIPGSPDKHHHFHPERHALLADIGGKAVRSARIQKMPYGLHHYGYHEIFHGPSLPENDEEKFRVAVLSAANVVPRQAIKILSADEWDIVNLTDKEHERLSKNIRVDNPTVLGRFFARYTSEQKIEDTVDEIVIEEFLHYRTLPKRRRELASFILGEAINFSVESLSLLDSHNELKKEGFIPQRKPKTPYSITKEYVRKRHLPYFEDLMTDRLAFS